ncbi:NRDE family protein [Halopseudomonas nanhaiensis]|uniref:NRDE family protein n=1 Tax=Halopseudomonas nanhaiensis TaxID=2830842 RepID=UPI001CC113E9|nr:NRDE family protein [Halopseudomonas nanhaiensis]UAW98873.1 NRDE family protein [Halopseudomonas nanhaiensis]
MCLIAFAWQQAGHRLLLLGNRDEFHARPTRPAAFWDEDGHPDLLAGQDLQARGTWLGVTRSGRFAALTNVRASGMAVGTRSRGELVAGFLASSVSPQAYLEELAPRCTEYGAFNLLVGDRDLLCYLNSREAIPSALAPGYYGLSNASLDTAWPKLVALRSGLQEAEQGSAEQLIALLADPQQYPDEQLPRTGVSQEWERALSAAFIIGETYGTRASSLLRITEDERIEFVERSFGPNATPLGEVRYEFQTESRPQRP